VIPYRVYCRRRDSSSECRVADFVLFVFFVFSGEYESLKTTFPCPYSAVSSRQTAMLRRCLFTLAVKPARRVGAAASAATTTAHRSSAARPVTRLKTPAPPSTSRQRRNSRTQRSAPRPTTTPSASSAVAAESGATHGVSLKRISVSFVVPQDPPVRSRYVNPTDFLGSTDPLLLTPSEKAAAAAEAAAKEAAAQATAAACVARSVVKTAARAAVTATPSAASERKGAAKNSKTQQLKHPSPRVTRAADRKATTKTTTTTLPSRKVVTHHLARARPGARLAPKGEQRSRRTGTLLKKPTTRKATASAASSASSSSAQKCKPTAKVKRPSAQRQRQRPRPIRHIAAARIRAAAAALSKTKHVNGTKTVVGKRHVTPAAARKRPPPRPSVSSPAARPKGMRLFKKPVRHVVTKSLRKKVSTKKK
jgi:hypothetical protein